MFSSRQALVKMHVIDFMRYIRPRPFIHPVRLFVRLSIKPSTIALIKFFIDDHDKILQAIDNQLKTV